MNPDLQTSEPLPLKVDTVKVDTVGLARELDALEAKVRASLGPADEAYIRRIVRLQLGLDLSGRGVIYLSLLLLPVWHHPLASASAFAAVVSLGVLLLLAAKILATMELGHNIMHGQWDYLGDPVINSNRWEWDAFVRSDRWKHMHNINHHPWANVLGKDQDLGWGMMRVTPAQKWHPLYLLQPLNNLFVAVFFQTAIVLQDLEIDPVLGPKPVVRDLLAKLRYAAPKVLRQVAKDYLFFPLLAGPFFLYVAAANGAANLLRNLWAYSVTYCGHFPAGACVFTLDDVAKEGRGEWYLRQMAGACNIKGGPLLHLATGHLSYQIEHHLFPDLPSRRYPVIAAEVQQIAARYGLPYNCERLSRQLATTAFKIVRLAFPTTAAPTRLAVRAV